MAKINLGRVVGYSAYEIALQNGYVGTEAEWVASLKGKDGKDGKTGSQGPMGPRGPEGPRGTFEELTPEQKESLRGYPGEQGPAGADYVITNADYDEIAVRAAERLQYDNNFIDWNELEGRLQDFEMGYDSGMDSGGSSGSVGGSGGMEEGSGSGEGSGVGYSLDQGQEGTGEGSNSDEGVAAAAASSPLGSASLPTAWVYANNSALWYHPDTSGDDSFRPWLKEIRRLVSKYSYGGYLFSFVFETENSKREIGKYSIRELFDNGLQWNKSDMGPDGNWAIEVDIKDSTRQFNINSSLAIFPDRRLPTSIKFEIWRKEGGGSSGGSSGGVENHIIRKNEFNSSISAFVNEAGVRTIVDEKLVTIANA